MTQTLNRQIVLANRPKGSPVPENFRLEQTAILLRVKVKCFCAACTCLLTHICAAV